MTSNFPAAQLTGAVGEDRVGLLFTTWGWTVGRDRIDAGYDLCVEPDNGRYRGSRFLVQVKGTAQKKSKGALVAQVSKARLRQYARNPHPVFLVRTTADGKLYWLHVQEWARINQSRLSGYGHTGIRLAPSQDLANREAFETYLDNALAPLSQKRGAVAALADERAQYLSSLDPRLRVRISVRDGAEVHHISALSPEVDAKVSFQTKGHPENLSNLREAMEFGLPRRIQVEEFQMSGSPLFEALGTAHSHSGAITIQSRSVRGIVHFYPGRLFTATSQDLSIEADLFVGQSGIAVNSDALKGLFKIDLRLRDEGDKAAGGYTIGLCQDLLTETPIQFLTELSNFGEWAEQVVEQQSLITELVFGRNRVPLPPQTIDEEQFGVWLSYVGALSRLHLVARCLNLDITLSGDRKMSSKERDDIDFAYALLRGHRVAVGSVSMEVSGAPLKELEATSHGLWATTNVVLSVGGQEIGNLPIALEMPDYVIEAVPDKGHHLIHHPNGGEAWATFNAGGPDDIVLRTLEPS